MNCDDFLPALETGGPWRRRAARRHARRCPRCAAVAGRLAAVKAQWAQAPPPVSAGDRLAWGRPAGGGGGGRGGRGGGGGGGGGGGSRRGGARGRLPRRPPAVPVRPRGRGAGRRGVCGGGGDDCRPTPACRRRSEAGRGAAGETG